MDRWTFDSVFSGPLEKQEWKLSHLLSGACAVYKQAEQHYAQAIIENDFDDAENALRRVTEVREFAAALYARPEVEVVREFSSKRSKLQFKDELQKLLIKELGLDDEVKS